MLISGLKGLTLFKNIQGGLLLGSIRYYAAVMVHTLPLLIFVSQADKSLFAGERVYFEITCLGIKLLS